MSSAIVNAINSTLITDHHYYPLEVGIAHYLVNDWSVPYLLTAFFGGLFAIFLGTTLVVNKVHPNLPMTEKAAIWWFVLSGTIHLFFEGYFSLNHATMGPSQHFFGQLWKEYAFSDSRYLTSDAFVLCMETVTAFTWGPICFIVAAYITTSNPLRHPLQIIVCVGQIYGLILYYATSMFDHYYKDVTYSRPEFLYFWFYYFFMNFIWMVIPGILLVSSVRSIAKAFKTLQNMDVTIKSSGTVNGAAYTNKLLNGNAKKEL